MMQRRFLAAAILGFSAYYAFGIAVDRERAVAAPDQPAAVVVAPAMQLILYGGDRFLAANIESIRATVSVGTMRGDESEFRARVHLAAARLNPCHEDNYWIGNGELTWGGRHPASFVLLKEAMDCRIWDPWPAFFYGFNLQFFNRRIDEARSALETAAQRADEGTATAFRSFSIALMSRQFDDASVAASLVRQEREKTDNPKLRSMLEQRAERLDGLASLRSAHAEFVRRFGRSITNPSELISSGILEKLPDDPTQLGYEFVDGQFRLRTLVHKGLESLR